MKIQNSIEQKLVKNFSPSNLYIQNESSMHAVPEGSESHFKVVLVSSMFSGLSRLERQRKVNSVLAEELAGPVHALSLRILTPEEWTMQAGNIPNSPNCKGGPKKDFE